MAAVLKTAEAEASVGSNPTPSASFNDWKSITPFVEFQHRSIGVTDAEVVHPAGDIATLFIDDELRVLSPVAADVSQPVEGGGSPDGSQTVPVWIIFNPRARRSGYLPVWIIFNSRARRSGYLPACGAASLSLALRAAYRQANQNELFVFRRKETVR